MIASTAAAAALFLGACDNTDTEEAPQAPVETTTAPGTMETEMGTETTAPGTMETEMGTETTPGTMETDMGTETDN